VVKTRILVMCTIIVYVDVTVVAGGINLHV
jgi:hypothetical protein